MTPKKRKIEAEFDLLKCNCFNDTLIIPINLCRIFMSGFSKCCFDKEVGD